MAARCTATCSSSGFSKATEDLQSSMSQAPEGASVHCLGQAAGLVQQVGKAHRSLTQNTRAATSSCAHRPCVVLVLYQHRSLNNTHEQTRPLAALEGWHSELWLRRGRATWSETPLRTETKETSQSRASSPANHNLAHQVPPFPQITCPN